MAQTGGTQILWDGWETNWQTSAESEVKKGYPGIGIGGTCWMALTSPHFASLMGLGPFPDSDDWLLKISVITPGSMLFAETPLLMIKS